MDSVQTVLITLLRISAGIFGMKYQLIFTLLFFLVPPFLFFPNLYFLLIFKKLCMLMLNWELFNLAFHCTLFGCGCHSCLSVLRMLRSDFLLHFFDYQRFSCRFQPQIFPFIRLPYSYPVHFLLGLLFFIGLLTFFMYSEYHFFSSGEDYILVMFKFYLYSMITYMPILLNFSCWQM